MNETKVIIKNVRFSYVHVFQKDNNDKYSVSLIIPKNHPQIAEIQTAIKNAATAGAGKLGDKYKLVMSAVLHDGDIDKNDDPTYENAYFLNAKSNTKPGIVKPNLTGMGGKTKDITDEAEFYSGCFGHASVNFFAFNTGTNKGVACGLNNLLKTKDGEFLGGRSTAESDFGGCEECNDDFPADDVC